MVHAAGAGFIDFKAWTGSRRDWVNLSLRLGAYESELASRVVNLDAMRQIVTMAMDGLRQRPDVLQEFAVQGVERYREAVMPWFKTRSRQNVGDPLDDIVDWYLTFRPDLIEEALRG